MFRLCKGKIRGGAGTVLLAIGLLMGFSIQCRASGTDLAVSDGTDAFAGICGEDEYVLLSAGNNYAEIYDSMGNCVGRCRAYMDDAYGAAIIKNDYLLDYSSGEEWNIFSMAELKNILEFPGEDYHIQVSGDVCLATNRYNGQFCLYDCHGNSLYSSEEGTSEEEEYQGRLLALDNGYLIGSYRFTDEGVPSALETVWVSLDGQESRMVTDPYLTEAFGSWQLQDFGENVLIYNWEYETGAVYDLDGQILLDQIDSYLWPYTDENWLYGYNYVVRTALALQKSDGMYTVYDTQLRECAMFPVEESESWSSGYASGFIKGVSYQQLDGNVCGGFVRYEDRVWVPYAQTEEGYLIYADGKQMRITLEEGQALNSFNDRYVMAEYYKDGEYADHLIDRETGEVLADYCWGENGGVSFELGTDYCIITDTQINGQESCTSIVVHNDENQISCSSENAYAKTWKNGYMVLDRGIYHGIADCEGNWIVRTILNAEE